MPALRSAQRAIESSDGLPIEDRERMIRELEVEIEALEAEEISFAPDMHGGSVLVQVNGVRVQLRPFAGEQSVLVIPAAILQVRVPVAAKVAKSELPI